MDITRIDFEITTRALRIACGGLRLVTGEQSCEVGGGNGDAVDYDLRDDDGAFGDDHPRAVIEDQDEITAFRAQVLERCTFGKHDHAIGVGHEDHVAAARLGPGFRAIAPHLLSRAVGTGLSVGKVVARFEAIHVFRPH